MPILSIANICFEKELEEEIFDFLPLIQTSPVFLQLQFLPFLYTSSEDFVLITQPAEKNYFESLSHIGFKPATALLPHEKLPRTISSVDTWGASAGVVQWVKDHHCPHYFPPLEATLLANSKAFSFDPEHGLLCFDLSQVKEWILLQKKRFVLKTCLGFSGKGHLIIDPAKNIPWDKIEKFCAREFSSQRSLLAQPWEKRLLDFSTQWLILPDKTWSYLGSTVCHNDTTGHYQGTVVGREESLFKNWIDFFGEHKKKSEETLSKLAEIGYFGNVGFDAFIYEDFLTHKPKLYPIVEINARKTMGWVALKIYEQLGKRDFLSLTIETMLGNALAENALLPPFVLDEKGTKTVFKKNLFFQRIQEI